MDILDLLTSQLNNNNVIDELSRSTGADSAKIPEAIKLSIPTMVNAMRKNASTPHGASSLSEALDEHKDHNIDDISAFLRNTDQTDGSKILDHILGNRKDSVQNNLSVQTGLKSNEISNIMTQLAPLLLGMLGKQKSSRNTSANDLPSMLMGLLGGSNNSGIMDMVTNFIDKDHDGSIIDDIGKIAGGFFNKD